MEEAGRKKLLSDIFDDFKSDEKVVIFLAENKIDNIALIKMIEANPAKMQLIRCHIEFYEKEKSSLVREVKRAKDGKLRKSIDCLVNATFEEQKHQEDIRINRIKREIPFDGFKLRIKNQLDLYKNDKYKMDYELIISKLEFVINYDTACAFSTWFTTFSLDKRFNPATFPSLFENTFGVNVRVTNKLIESEMKAFHQQVVSNEIKIVPKDKLLRKIFTDVGHLLEKFLEVSLWTTYTLIDEIEKIRKNSILMNNQIKELKLKISNFSVSSETKDEAKKSEKAQLIDALEKLRSQESQLLEEEKIYSPKISEQDRELITAYRTVFKSGPVYTDKALAFVDKYMSHDEYLCETAYMAAQNAISNLREDKALGRRLHF